MTAQRVTPMGQRQGQERRKWSRLDLSALEDNGFMVTTTLGGGKAITGGIRNISTGGLCVEFPAGEALSGVCAITLRSPVQRRSIDGMGMVMWRGPGSRPGTQQVGLAITLDNVSEGESTNPTKGQR